MDKSMIPRAFLLLMLAGILYLCYLVFSPFLADIIVAGVLATILHPLYIKLSVLLKGRKKTAALIICLAVILIAVAIISNLIIYSAQKLIETYGNISNFISHDGLDPLLNNRYLHQLGVNLDNNLRTYLFDALGKVNQWLITGATSLIAGTTNFIFSLALIILSMFFFLIDGENMLKRIMRWTPLPNKYDQKIFRKFKDVSQSAVLSTILNAAAQGFFAGLGFWVVGLPAFLGGILTSVFSLVPYVGAGLVWFPAAVYLLLAGKIWQGIFMIAWGTGGISIIDNVIRAYIIKEKAQVHPLFIIFSILGGVAFFGFWGIIFGPLIISLAVTILHIYEIEYESILEK
ncbi:MAG: AI-2E family transporter [Patescibacteria group bacterium]|jgi:predicted PurR-regulated permease PerM